MPEQDCGANIFISATKSIESSKRASNFPGLGFIIFRASESMNTAFKFLFLSIQAIIFVASLTSMASMDIKTFSPIIKEIVISSSAFLLSVVVAMVMFKSKIIRRMQLAMVVVYLIFLIVFTHFWNFVVA